MYKQHHLIKSIVLSLTLLISVTFANVDDSTTAQLMLDNNSGEITQPALLLSTEITGEINGMIATMTLTQVFKNTSDQWMNGRYLFPLSEEAVIDSLTLTTEHTVLRGEIQEKQQAIETFEAAKAEGKQAGLLTQQRPNLFNMALANIAPGEEVRAEITWVETVAYQAGEFSLRLPTTLTQRYTSAESVTEAATETDMAVASPSVPAELLDNPRVFSLDIDLEVGLPIDEIKSSTHDITVNTIGDSHQIELSNQTELLNKDVIISWQPIAGFYPNTAVFSELKDGDYYYFMMITPPVKNIVSTLPKDVTFIIDTSGSMSGDSMMQAKLGLQAGLEALSSQDLFNIVEFNSDATRLYPEAKPVSTRNINEAKSFVNALQADGGTEMLSALRLALSQPDNSDYLRQIIFITDGAVSNEQTLFKYLHDNLGDARLFTVAIGSAPNMHFMSGAAKYGRGTSTSINNLANVNKQITTLIDKISQPMLQNIKLELPFNDNVEVYPEKIPDLYTAEPIMVTVKSDNPIDLIKIDGQMQDESWGKELSTDTGDGNNIHKIWAKDKVNAIAEQSVLYGQPLEDFKADIVAIGLANQIVTPFTAFVAVEEKISKPENLPAGDEMVANLIPSNSALYAPNTATPAMLQILVGLFILLLAFSYYWVTMRQRQVLI